MAFVAAFNTAVAGPTEAKPSMMNAFGAAAATPMTQDEAVYVAATGIKDVEDRPDANALEGSQISAIDAFESEFGVGAAMVVRSLASNLGLSEEEAVEYVGDDPSLMVEQARQMLALGQLEDEQMGAYVAASDEFAAESGVAMGLSEYEQMLEDQAREAEALEFNTPLNYDPNDYKLPDRNGLGM